MNINSNYLPVNFKDDIVVKLSPWFCGYIESKFYVYLSFILRQFVNGVLVPYTITYKHIYMYIYNIIQQRTYNKSFYERSYSARYYC